MTPSVSLIISTYNRPDALRLVLESVRRQTLTPMDVVVCDDGSRDDTRALVEKLRDSGFPGRLVHVWHEDRGFRLAEIRNKGVAECRGEYIVQIDGDMMLDRHFVEDHARLARKGFYIKGTRIMLNESYTRRLERRGRLPMFLPGLLSRGIAKNRIKSLRLPWLGFKKTPTYRTKGTGIGANMSFWREDFMKVNGYDESFTGWGCEDTDLMDRLERMGVRTFKTFHLAKAYHLYHPESKNPRLEEANRKLREKIESGEIRCSNGIDKHMTHNG
jgi:glycosyltransferase involved in cell wall biosynthesis